MALFLTGFAAAFLVWLNFGGGAWRSEVSVVEAELRSPTRLELRVGSCHGFPDVVQFQETDVDVQVRVVAFSTPFRGGRECLDTVEVQLGKPLGGRVVVDNHTGRSVRVITVR